MPSYTDRTPRGEPKSEREKNGIVTSRKGRSRKGVDRIEPPITIFVRRSNLGQCESYALNRANPDDLEYILKSDSRSD